MVPPRAKPVSIKIKTHLHVNGETPATRPRIQSLFFFFYIVYSNIESGTTTCSTSNYTDSNSSSRERRDSSNETKNPVSARKLGGLNPKTLRILSAPLHHPEILKIHLLNTSAPQSSSLRVSSDYLPCYSRTSVDPLCRLAHQTLHLSAKPLTTGNARLGQPCRFPYHQSRLLESEARARAPSSHEPLPFHLP